MKKILGSPQFQMVAFAALVLIAAAFGVIDPHSAVAYGMVGAVVTVKSTAIGNRDAVPSVISPRYLMNANVQVCRGVAAIANGDSIGSKYIMFQLPSNAMPESVLVSCPAIATAVGDIGLYQTTQNGGAVVNASFFKAAQALTAAITKTEVSMGNVITPANGEKPIWQLLGLAADPRVVYDVVITLTAAATAAGSVLLEADFSV